MSGASSPHLRVLRFRKLFQVRLLLEACLADLTACSQSTEEAKWLPTVLSFSWRGWPRRCEAVQPRGQHLYLVTLALCRVLIFEHLSWEIKGAGGKPTSVGTAWCYAEESPHLRRPIQVRLSREACFIDLTACPQSTEEAKW